MNNTSSSIKPRSGLLNTFVEYFFCFILLISAYSVYFKISNTASLIIEVLLFFSAFIVATSHSPKRRDRVNSYFLGFLVFLVILLVLSTQTLLTVNSFVLSYTLQKYALLAGIIPVFVIMFMNMGSEYISTIFFPRLSNTLCALCILGLTLWVSKILNISLPTFTLSYAWGGPQKTSGVLGLYLPVQSAGFTFAGQAVPRFTLFFVEGPLANFAFQTVLVQELFLTKVKSKVRIYILALSSVCSFTTASFIMLPIIFILWGYTSPRFRQISRTNFGVRLIRNLFIALFMCVVPIWSMYQISNKTNTASLEIHMKDISTGVSSFLKSPIVGHGIGNYADSYMQFGGGAGLSSGVLAVAAQGGVLLLIIYLAPLFLGARQAFEERKLNIAVSICISTASFFAIILDNNTLFALALAFYLSYYFEASRKS